MPVGDLYEPVTYSWWLAALGWLAIALVAGWIVYVLRSTRARPEELPPPRPTMPSLLGDRFAEVRPVYLARVDDIEQRFRAGELDVRGLHLELSAVVRDFATVRRGVDATVLTLSDLRRLDGARHLAGLIETYYRPAFARYGATDTSPEASLHGARQVIARW